MRQQRAADEAADPCAALLAFGAFAGVVVAAGGVVQRAERSEPERVLEAMVAATVTVIAVDRTDRLFGDGLKAGVGGEVSGGGESDDVSDLDEDGG